MIIILKISYLTKYQVLVHYANMNKLMIKLILLSYVNIKKVKL